MVKHLSLRATNPADFWEMVLAKSDWTTDFEAHTIVLSMEMTTWRRTATLAEAIPECFEQDEDFGLVFEPSTLVIDQPKIAFRWATAVDSGINSKSEIVAFQLAERISNEDIEEWLVDLCTKLPVTIKAFWQEVGERGSMGYFESVHRAEQTIHRCMSLPSSQFSRPPEG